MRRLAFLALAVAFSLIWSSAFVAGKIALARFDPATILSTRFALSALLLAPFARGGFDRRTIALGLSVGALNNAIYLGLTFSALTLVRPVVVVAIAGCAPFATAALAAGLGVEAVRPRQFAGALIGLAGVVVITGLDMGALDLAGVVLAAFGALAFSCATLILRARAQGAPVQALNFWQSIAGALALAPFAWLHGRGFGADEGLSLADPALLAILYLAVVVTIGGMTMWLALIRIAGAASASACHLMNPFFGALLAALVLGTPLKLADFLGAAIIALGLALNFGLGPARPGRD